MDRKTTGPEVRLRPQRPERVGHPWIFAGEIAGASPGIQDGSVVRVVDSRGKVSGMALFNARSKITLRMLSSHDELIDGAWWFRKVAAALARRTALYAVDATTALRLVHGEADGLPGLTVDQYGPVLVVQVLALGLEPWRDVLLEALWEMVRPETIWERSDVSVRALEGLDERSGLLAGAEPADLVEVREGSARLLVDVRHGQKTGMFLDQRRNRYAVASYSDNATVLNCFAYSGAFGVHCALGGAREVINVDISGDACALADQNMALNGFAPRHQALEANCFDLLRSWSDRGDQFDMVILDPPAFTKNRATVEGALRGYKEINLRALRLLRPGGILITCSCSQHVDETAFKTMLRAAARDARRDVLLLEQGTQGPDHPVLLRAPESHYLTCLIAAVE